MTTPASRPPWVAVALFLLLVGGLGGWVMLHAYSDHDPGECGGRYQRARSAADSAVVDRFVPDSEHLAIQERSCAMLRVATPAEFARADSLVTRAIAATGGDSALAALRAIEWEGTATLHPGGGSLVVEGEWRIAPPDTMVVTTWRPGDRPGSTRRLVVMGGTAWSEAGDDSVEMSTAERDEQRHLSYVFALLRLLPLREPGVTYLHLPPDATGRPGVMVRTPGQLDTALYFGSDGRVEVVRTRAATARGMPAVEEEITFAGTTEVAGVKWFGAMHETRDGVPVLDLTISAARP